jgi:hypothetical protein
MKDYTNSKQKKDGNTVGMGADIHYLNSMYKVNYEYSEANTYKPPMTEDLENKKLFLQYAYRFNQKTTYHLNYINVLEDNIAITTHGKAYGIGMTYLFNKNLATRVTQYYTSYRDFSVAQSDFKLEYKSDLYGCKYKLSSVNKYIIIHEKTKNSFTKNTQDSYFTTGIKAHIHYGTYHMGAGIYFGKRAFAIMNDGFKLQHHAMEFDRTSAIGIGKNIENFVLRFQYVYQRATELPIDNSNVTISTSRFIINYKF